MNESTFMHTYICAPKHSYKGQVVGWGDFKVVWFIDLLLTFNFIFFNFKITESMAYIV